jgi:WhiB family transcriptional regulator, redox-sensing transcriptional regulator
VFFPVSGAGPSVTQIAEAKTVCARCEVRGEGLAFALTTRQPPGIWGGTNPEERTVLRSTVLRNTVLRSTVLRNTVLRNEGSAAGLADAAMVS